MADGPQRNPLTDPGDFTVRYIPENVERFPGILDAVAGFDAGDRPAGRAATEFLRGIDVQAVEETATTLFFLDGALVGYFSLANGSAELKTRDRKRFALGRPTQPAALVTWLAKSAHHTFDGLELVKAAAYQALRGAEFSAVTLLALDPFDQATAEMWQDRHGFVASQTKLPRNEELRRLVLPLRTLVS